MLCQLNLHHMPSDGQSGRTESNGIQAGGQCESATECRKVMFGGPKGTRTGLANIPSANIFSKVLAFVDDGQL